MNEQELNSLLASMEAERGKLDLFYFCKNILGMPIDEQPHKEMAEEIAALDRFGLLLWPRHHLKSTVGTEGYSMWRIIRNPNIRILVTNAKLDNSRKFLASIVRHFQTNVKLRALYGEHIGRAVQDEFISAQRTAHGLKEPTIQVSAMGASVVSQHYDLIIGDDLVNADWVGTPERVEQTIDYFKSLLDLLEPTGKILIIGTRWDFHDLYGYLIEQYKDDPRWKISVRGAYKEDGSPLYPGKFSLQALEELKRDEGPRQFNLQYNNNPVPDEGRALPDPQYYDRRPANLRVTVTVDLAISERDRADYTVIMACGTDERNNLYVLEYERGHFNPGETIEKIFQMDDRYRPRCVGIETVAYQKALIWFLQEEMRRRGRFLRLEELRADRDKPRRILALEPRLANGSIFVRRDMVELIDEIIRFTPNGVISGHDDCLDALAYQLQIIQTATPVRKAPRSVLRTKSLTGY